MPINAGRIVAGLKRNIKVEYINETREGPPNHPLNSITIEDKINDVTIDLSKMNVKTVYNKLIDNNYSPPRVENFWKFFFFTQTLNWNYIWNNGGSEILDFKDKDLRFKLKHRILPTKDKLKNYGITQENSCPLCKDNIETIEHLFIYCIKHIDTWLFVEQLIRKYTNNNTFCLNDVSRILGEGINDQLHRSIWKIV